MRIEFLYWSQCPSHEDALDRLMEILAEEEAEGDLETIEVASDEEAQDLQFIGSPTIRIEGEDIDPEGLRGRPCRLACRVYRRPDGSVTSLPPEALIRAAIHKHM